ncbi:MAG: hypothetical protein LUD72_02645 [Bacteroidales bacterium]|nr:hypothetical protein [Bacteroidales bacterium]
MTIKDIIDSCALREPTDEFEGLQYADWEKTLQSEGKWLLWALADQLTKLGFPEDKEIFFNEKGGVAVAKNYRAEDGKHRVKLLEIYGPSGYEKTQSSLLEDLENLTTQL